MQRYANSSAPTRSSWRLPRSSRRNSTRVFTGKGVHRRTPRPVLGSRRPDRDLSCAEPTRDQGRSEQLLSPQEAAASARSIRDQRVLTEVVRVHTDWKIGRGLVRGLQGPRRSGPRRRRKRSTDLTARGGTPDAFCRDPRRPAGPRLHHRVCLHGRVRSPIRAAVPTPVKGPSVGRANSASGRAEVAEASVAPLSKPDARAIAGQDGTPESVDWPVVTPSEVAKARQEHAQGTVATAVARLSQLLHFLDELPGKND